jgi:chemotaxis protein methyltransferase CheR
MEDSQFTRLLDRFRYSRAGFRKVRKGVEKRLARHMQETGCRNIGDYIEVIERNQDVRLQFERLMTVSISRFFRDQGLWEKMQGQILPIMAKKACQVVRVWSAGCASGEEVYSFKILWEGLRGSYARIPDLSILATDMNPEYLDRARTAIYSRSSMREMAEPIRSTYFETLANGKYALGSWIKEGIVWQAHNILSDPPGVGFDLIFLRNNLLTYYADGIKIPAFLRVIDSLALGGFLIIGSHERIPVEPTDLNHWGGSAYIFQREADKKSLSG